MHLEMGWSMFWVLASALCCDGPHERDAMQHGSATLVTHGVVLAGEREEELSARTIIAVIVEKWALLQRTSFILEKQHMSPSKPRIPGPQLFLMEVSPLLFFLKKKKKKDCWIEHSKFENAKMKVAWATALHWMRKWSCETNIKWSCNWRLNQNATVQGRSLN